MAIKIQHGSVVYVVDTPEEAARLGALLDGAGVIDTVQAAADDSEVEFTWTPEIFRAFIDHLGEPQRKALVQLTKRGKATDAYLRETLGVSDNQALGGFLSGISKQALALGIPARAVFKCENYRNAGKRRSLYFIDNQFQQIAVLEKIDV